MKIQANIVFQLIGVVLLAAVAFISFTFWHTVFFTGGVMVGVTLLWLDRLVLFAWYQGKTIHTVDQYITRSFLFILAYVAAAFFVVTSTSGVLGIGVVLGIGLVLLSELVALFSSPAQLNMLVGVQKPLKKNEVRYLVGGFTFWYCFLLLITFLQ